MSVFFLGNDAGHIVRFDTGEKTAEEVLREFVGSPKNGHYVQDKTEAEYLAQDPEAEEPAAEESSEAPAEAAPEEPLESVE